MKKTQIITLFIIFASFALAIYLYPQMPDQMASHWDASGKVNGTMFKFWGLFLMPIISVGVWLIMIVIPKLDPKKANIAEFRQSFDTFILLLVLFLFYIFALTLIWNLGRTFDFIVAIIPAFAILFYYIGELIGSAKQNWSIGIRTPWTLSSETIWNKTHKLGGKMFKGGSVLCLLGLLMKDYAIWFVILPAIGVALFLFIYSYLEFKKEVH
jgi:uncharacterized membrane protein